jgi:hypothetical protein
LQQTRSNLARAEGHEIEHMKGNSEDRGVRVMPKGLQRAKVEADAGGKSASNTACLFLRGRSRPFGQFGRAVTRRSIAQYAPVSEVHVFRVSGI